MRTIKFDFGLTYKRVAMMMLLGGLAACGGSNSALNGSADKVSVDATPAVAKAQIRALSVSQLAPALAQGQVLLVGDEGLGAQVDTNVSGQAEAFSYVATASGAASQFNLYLDASNTASTVIVAVYADASDRPTTRLATATISAPQSGAWNAVSLPDLPIVAGSRYWLAMMAPVGGGAIKFRDKPGGGGTAWTTTATNLTAFPSTWSVGQRYADSPASAYLSSIAGTPPPPPPPPPPNPDPTPVPVPGVSLDTHQVYVDGSGKLVSWVSPIDKAYDTAAFLSFDFLLNRVPIDPANGLAVTYTHSEYDPDSFVGSAWPNNPAGKAAMLADSAALYYAYSGNRAVITLVQGLLDHHLARGTTPSTYVWAGVPWSTGKASSADFGNDDRVEGIDVLEPDKIGELGYHGYLRFWQLTGDIRYRDAALACANVLAAKIRTGSATQSPWPFRVNARTGAIVEDYTAHVIAPIRLFDELIRLNLGNVAAYQSARQQAWNWLMTFPMVNNNWTQYFEDVGVYANRFANLNQYSPGQTARYLLERPELDSNWQSKSAALINFIENNFGGTDAGEAGLQYGARVISEQNEYKYKMASHTSRYGAVNALYAAATGDLVAKDKAYRALNWATYMARNSGAVNEGPTEFQVNRNFWFTDGHGDYVRHFMLAMGAFPEWAPKAQNHLLRASTVVTRAAYSSAAVEWDTFDAAGTATLRVASAPISVTAGGVSLSRRTDLAAEGYTYDASTGVLQVRHSNARQMRVNFTATNAAPTVSFTSPTAGATFTAPASIDLLVQANDDRGISRVEFFNGAIKIGEATAAPYRLLWPAGVGTYSLKAVATDTDGLTAQASVSVTVLAAGPAFIFGSQVDTANQGTDFITDATGAYINANSFLSTRSATASAVYAKVAAISGRYQVAIYADAAGQPGALLTSSTEQTPNTNGWQRFPLRNNVAVQANTRYWLAIWSNDVAARVFVSSGTLYWGLQPYSTTWPTSLSLPGRAQFTYSMYAAE